MAPKQPSFKPSPVKAAAKAQAVVPAIPRDTEEATPSAPFKYETVGTPPPPEPGKLPLPAPRQGRKWVFNRLQEDYSTDFDGHPQMFGPNEFRDYDVEIAYFIAANSIIQFGRGRDTVRALVLENKQTFGVPFPKEVTTKDRVEYIDRVADPNPIGRGTDGVPTKPKIVYV